jgi:hypothetical protein
MNQAKPGEFIVEPPTLICLGFEWYIEGDENHNAVVEVSYREKGEDPWKKALPLLRIQNEESIATLLSNNIDYIAPNLFAGSIFDLKPDTEYECKFLMSDPDGVQGNPEKIVTVRTRPEPQPYEAGQVYHVYPADHVGPKKEPAFPNLTAAYYTGWCEADWWNVAPPRVKPGDMILVHAGVYKDDWNIYGADISGQGMGTLFQGTYYLTAKGTPEKPIVIKAAGDGEAIFDGNGNFNLFNVLAADYHYFDGLSIRNTYVAFLAGNKNILGSSGLTVKRCHFEDVNKGVHTDWSGSKNFYIADNVFIGRHDPETLHTWINFPEHRSPYPYERCLSEYAVKVAGAGHVICHNYIANFHDGIDHATYGVPDGYPPYGHPDVYPVKEVLDHDRTFVSIDIYNNLIMNVHDNFIEADGAMYNIRVLRNLCINAASRALSSQTLFGGPAYFIRNIVYHAPDSIKHAQNPSGSIYYHNTFAAKIEAAQSSNFHFRNNLILGWQPSETIFSIDTFTNYSSSDYNGFRPDLEAKYSFVWKSPPFDLSSDYVGERQERKFGTLKDYSQATGQDANSRLVDYNAFLNLTPADPDNLTRIYKYQDLDFRLKPDTSAVDAGCILPNVNDDFTGNAPDLGALEVGMPEPIYGPRPLFDGLQKEPIMRETMLPASLAAEEIMRLTEDLCSISGYGITSGIHAGKTGDEAARYILGKLRTTGLASVQLEPIKVHDPYPEAYEVTVKTEGKDISLTESCFPLQWSSGTSMEGIEGDLVYVGDGSRSYFEIVDVTGKIVLIDEKFMRGYIPTAQEPAIIAKEKGAIAVFRANMYVDSPQQQKREAAPTNIFPIPVFCFSKTGGDYLRDLVRSGISHSIKIKLLVSHQVRDASNIVFQLPGNGSTDEVVLIGTHYDSGHFTGAVDNNGSVALMIKLAEYFASEQRESRNRDMIFAWCFGHDFDLNSGHYQFAEAHKDRLRKAIVWDVDHALGGVRYIYDEIEDRIVPVEGETCEFYITSNNYSFARLAAFSMDRHGFTCTQKRFESSGRGPQWGMAPDTSPWVNVASIPLYYHSTLDTPDKITLKQAEQAYAAHIEILKNIGSTPEGFFFYDNISKTRPSTPPRVSIAILSDTVRAGDTVKVWNDETRFYDNKTSYHYPALPEWAGAIWDWGDGSPATIGGEKAMHVYRDHGAYVITLKFTDTEGAEGRATREVTVL